MSDDEETPSRNSGSSRRSRASRRKNRLSSVIKDQTPNVPVLSSEYLFRYSSKVSLDWFVFEYCGACSYYNYDSEPSRWQKSLFLTLISSTYVSLILFIIHISHSKFVYQYFDSLLPLATITTTIEWSRQTSAQHCGGTFRRRCGSRQSWISRLGKISKWHCEGSLFET